MMLHGFMKYAYIGSHVNSVGKYMMCKSHWLGGGGAFGLGFACTVVYIRCVPWGALRVYVYYAYMCILGIRSVV